MRIVVLVTIFLSVNAMAFSENSVPHGITYIKASPEINKKTIETINEYLHRDLSQLFGTHVIIGPGLWKNIHKSKAIKNSDIITTNINIPITAGVNKGKFQTLNGGLLQTQEQVSIFLGEFKKNIAGKHRVRKLNEKELKIYWSLIPYDITEPVFIVETGSKQFLFDFVKGLVFHIDDMSEYK